ncbi:MAG: LysR family transcriptional regulator [Myxococcota bacterium]
MDEPSGGELKGLRVFVEVVRRGGFAAAARVLGLPRSTVSRWVRELEEDLGARLLQRTTRKVELTEIGAGYYERAAKAVDAAGQASAWVQSQVERPQGSLVVATFQLFAETLLAPLLVRYLEENPEVEVRVVLDERNVDLVSEHVDVAVRVGAMPDSSLVVRRLATLEGWLLASPAYLERHGTPLHPDELVDHSTIVYSHTQEKMRVQFKKGRQRVEVALVSRCTANSIGLVRQLTLDGVGLGALPPILVRDDVAAGRLVRVLPDWNNDASQPVYAVYPTRKYLPRKVRSFVDLVKNQITSPVVNGA